MKVKDLPILEIWESRKPILENGFLHVPRHYHEHENWAMPPFESEELFGNKNEIHLEYCSGNGEWIIKYALENPEINWIGVERQFDRAKKIYLKKERLGLKNLLVVHGNAEEFTKYYVKEEQISKIYINFPDPWPKTRHKKHRLVQKDFICDMHRVLKRKSSLMIVTDDANYALQAVNEVLETKMWRSEFDSPYFVTQYANYGPSYFYRLWESKGREIRYMKFISGEC